MKRARRPRELFLSHASADHKFVDKVASFLRKEGIRVWYSRHHLVGADRWHDEIGRALRRCDWFLVVVSRKSVRSMWVRREVMFALKQRRFQNRMIPLLYQDCSMEQLSWALDDSQTVDFRDSFSLGCRKLLEIWK